MLSQRRQPNETLEAWESRLIAEQPARERANARAATLGLSDAEYRLKAALLTAPPRRPAPNLPDVMGMSDAEYAAAKASAGIFTASLMRL